MTPWTCPLCHTIRPEGGESLANAGQPCRACWVGLTPAQKASYIRRLRLSPIPALAHRDPVASASPLLRAYVAHLEELTNTKEPTQ